MNVVLTNSKTREPQQQRSIEKKNRIIEAGFKAFCEKGYYKTNRSEERRGGKECVSTWIIRRDAERDKK